MKLKRVTSLLLICSMLISGCSSHSDNSEETNDRTRYLDLKGEFTFSDTAHFISAPDIEYRESGITSFDVSYTMTVSDTDASFVLGDAKGEYGKLILCQINSCSGSDKTEFCVKSYTNGCCEEIVTYDGSDDGGLFYFERPEDDNYNVSLNIHDGKLSGFVNGTELPNFSIPSFSLGTVGAYKSRNTMIALLDDIKVVSSGQEVFCDNFDGTFTNKLYEYDYLDEPESAFDPYYIKTKDNAGSKALVVSSGFTLSETQADSAPVFKLEFKASPDKTKEAILELSSLGTMDIFLNGTKVTENYFEPGDPVYSKYLSSVSYDVTDLLQKENTLLVYLFHGFYDRGVGSPNCRSPWGDKLALIGDITISQDKETKVICTDENWLVARDNRYRFNDIYNGEIIDDRFNEPLEFGSVEVDNTGTDQVKKAVRLGTNSVKEAGLLQYREVTEPVNGQFVYDFGTNIAGTIKIDLSKLKETLNEGQVITIRYGETLNSPEMTNTDGEYGTIWTQNLLTARATDYYICGENVNTEISFDHTYHGFRYIEITGLSEAVPNDAIRAIVLSAFSASDKKGYFNSSDELINSFYACASNSLRANLMCVPTDCDQRDERLGWAGDAQITSGFSMYEYDGDEYYRNYLRALRSMQGEDGAIPDVAVFKSAFGGHSCWGDAITEITWNLYLHYGDINVLEENYEAMCSWADYLTGLVDGGFVNTEGYGDHLSIQTTDSTLLDTAWTYHTLKIIGKTCLLLGYEDVAKTYEETAQILKTTWQESYIREDYSVEGGILLSDLESETAYALGISFDLFSEEMKPLAAARLNILAEYSGYCFCPGYAGMRYLLPALADYGYIDTAIKILTNTAPGGLCNPLSNGLTTLPEELGAFRFNDDGTYFLSGSLNHAAFSSVCEFVYTDLLGIRPDESAPGFEHFYLKPCVFGEVSVTGSYECRYGTIKVTWNAADKTMAVEVPKSTSCTLTLPSGEVRELEEGNYSLSW